VPPGRRRVTKFLVYNARKRQEGGDTAAAYFERTECVAGVQDARFQQLMPDVIHWLDLRRIDRFVSMSDMKYHSLVSQRVEIVETMADGIRGERAQILLHALALHRGMDADGGGGEIKRPPAGEADWPR
jgi:GTP cyclohydrolase II